MLTFLTTPNGSKIKYLNVHESNLVVIISLFTLSVFSIFFGYLFSDLFVGIGNNAFSSSLFVHPNNINLVEAEFSIPLIFKLLPVTLSAIGAAIAIITYQIKPELFILITDNVLGKNIYTFLNGKYFFDIIYNHYIVRKSLNYGYHITNILEKGVFEIMGPYGLSNVLFKTGNNISKLDTGIITSYALYIVLGLISLIFLVFFPVIIDISNYPLLILELRLSIIYLASFILYLIL
jgi:NADH-ubiquinone oxidoreductase chain 5